MRKLSIPASCVYARLLLTMDVGFQKFKGSLLVILVISMLVCKELFIFLTFRRSLALSFLGCFLIVDELLGVTVELVGVALELVGVAVELLGVVVLGSKTTSS